MSATDRDLNRVDELKEAIHEHVRQNPQAAYEQIGVEFSGRDNGVAPVGFESRTAE